MEWSGLPSILGRWHFTDGSWKGHKFFFGQGWYSILESFDDLMEERNMRESLSPLHLEIEAFIWAMECIRNLRQYYVTFAMDYFLLTKMISATEE